MQRFAYILLSLFTLTVTKVMAQEVVQGLFDCGEQVRIEATPLPGYRFVAWSDGDTSRVRELDVEGDIDLQAIFDLACHDVAVPVVLVNDWVAAVDRHWLIEEGLIEESMPEDSVRWYKQGVERSVGSGFVLQLKADERLQDYYVEVSISEAVAKAHFICSRVLRGYPIPPTDIKQIYIAPSATKYLKDGSIYIQREKQTYTLYGMPLAPVSDDARL